MSGSASAAANAASTVVLPLPPPRSMFTLRPATATASAVSAAMGWWLASAITRWLRGGRTGAFPGRTSSIVNQVATRARVIMRPAS